jgi:hypothetical protein
MYCIVNGQLSMYAQEWATKLAREGKFQHRTDRKYGENLYCFWSSSPQHVSAQDACDSWYSEIKDYRFGQENQDIMRTGILYITYTILLWCVYNVYFVHH